MNPKRLIPIILLLSSCEGRQNRPSIAAFALTTIRAEGTNPYPKVGSIPVPAGYQRIPADRSSFAGWLRDLPLKKDRTVYLYDGSRKRNQDAQYAVLDVSVNDPSISPGSPMSAASSSKDLQQCADAVMRLRAEFLYSQNDFAHIDFYTGQGTRLNFADWLKGKRFRESRGRLVPYLAGAREPGGVRKCFGEYLQIVFSYCGTLTLQNQLVPVPGPRPDKIRIGDVIIHGGSPGHAMIVMDIAQNGSGQKIYFLAQGYMPAQDIHIVKNIYDDALNPWYPVDGNTIYTPEYTFYPGQLRTWPETSVRSETR
jgi:hypothetical protein